MALGLIVKRGAVRDGKSEGSIKKGLTGFLRFGF
jgi:hypothetical protein